MNNAATLTASNVANIAHATAEKILAAGHDLGTDLVGHARAAAVGIPAAHLDLFVERFVGHVINVQCGTAGR